jgi:hypothetical protein
MSWYFTLVISIASEADEQEGMRYVTKELTSTMREAKMDSRYNRQ